MCKTLTRDNFCATQNDHLSFAFSFSFSQVRELVTGSENCPYDWVRLYDGVDEYSPLIGHFCGIGSFPRFMMILIGLIQSCHKVIVNLLQVNNRNFKQALPRVYIIPCRTPLKHWLWLQVNIRSSLYKQCIHQTKATISLEIVDRRVTSVPGTGRSALNGSCHQVCISPFEK